MDGGARHPGCGAGRRSLRHCSDAVLFCAVVLALAVGGASEPGNSGRPVVLAGQTMGTTYRIVVASLPPRVTRQTLHREVDRVLDQIDRRMSTYKDDSEVSRFNRSDTTDWFAVSQQTATVLGEAIRISAATGGAFDPTVGPLVNLWSFGADRHTRRVPSDAEISELMAAVGYAKLAARQSPPAIRKQAKEIQIDLSAIAKGYAVDQLADLLRSRKVEAFLVEVGGETRGQGTKASGQPWRVGIEAPVEGVRTLWTSLELANASLATSGDYRNFFVADGRHYSHTLDPRTGRPIEHSLASVSVVDASCMRADALATALMVLGPDEGFQMAKDNNLAVMFLVRRKGRLVELVTPRFARLKSARPPTLAARSWILYLVATAVAFAGMMTTVLVRYRRHGHKCHHHHEPTSSSDESRCQTCASPSPQCDSASKPISQKNEMT